MLIEYSSVQNVDINSFSVTDWMEVVVEWEFSLVDSV
jgi:hypothetical protein